MKVAELSRIDEFDALLADGKAEGKYGRVGLAYDINVTKEVREK